MLNARAFVNRKKGTIGGTNLLGWQLALVVIASVLAFLLLAGVCFWIIRQQRRAYLHEEPKEGDSSNPNEADDADAATLGATKHRNGTIDHTSPSIPTEEEENRHKELRGDN